MTLSSLIERLEKATGPDRDLGNEVLAAVGWRKVVIGYFRGPMERWVAPDGNQYDDGNQPNPTASLDSAMTLARTNNEFLVMMSFATTAADYGDPDDKPNAWPSIKAMLIRALKSRLSDVTREG